MTSSAAGGVAYQQHFLARATAIFAGLLLLISLGLVWFRVGGGSKGRVLEVTGLQSLLIGLGGSNPVRPRGGFTLTGLFAGTLPFLVVVCAAVALLALALLPRLRGVRPASVVLSALATLLPIAMTLMSFTILRATAVQPALWIIFIAAAAGLWAAIAVSDPGPTQNPPSEPPAAPA
ncbi:hypothetical protein [Arthrobacter russicus]|uniref:Small-conductance mechanosensitive channel n=1 Tax=Arthrobacter russicus TaxID=172040 RepID=A0ABU1J9H4_9MICC|nr:hypothetical protein [Arthrobacter russicus]MDN5669028.1 hypothetical protein [Renibacterium salmoninarum]MDR6268531.1 small-conductance mechanosensitive channel [Arthrobacter russicus]